MLTINNAHQKKIAYFKQSLFALTTLFTLPTMTHATDIEHLRGQRYCEVIFWHGLSGFVYNTLHLNQCPTQLWSKLTPDIVKKEAKAHFVYLNGPRHYVADSVKNLQINPANIKVFGQIPMHQTASMRIKVKDIFLGATPYREHQVERDLVWGYQAGKPIYELIDSHGQVYVMQSYTSEVHKQSEANLAQLKQQLRLPKGWSFKTGILKSDQNLMPYHHHAVIVLDSYKNLYQRVSKDLLS